MKGDLSRRGFLKKGLAAAGVLAAGPAILAACGGDDGDTGGAGATETGAGPAETGGAPAVSGDAIKVGPLQDLTGPISQYGSQKYQSLQLAVEDINSKGGVLGRELVLVNYDTQSSDDRAVEFTQTLISRDQVPVIHGTA